MRLRIQRLRLRSIDKFSKMPLNKVIVSILQVAGRGASHFVYRHFAYIAFGLLIFCIGRLRLTHFFRFLQHLSHFCLHIGRKGVSE
jgi:hypothetical protein